MDLGAEFTTVSLPGDEAPEEGAVEGVGGLEKGSVTLGRRELLALVSSTRLGSSTAVGSPSFRVVLDASDETSVFGVVASVVASDFDPLSAFLFCFCPFGVYTWFFRLPPFLPSFWRFRLLEFIVGPSPSSSCHESELSEPLKQDEN